MPDPASGGAIGLAAFCGQAALVLSLLMVAICAARVWPLARRVRRKARVLESRARQEREVLLDGMALLLVQGMEMDRLLEPWRRIFFWAGHPLTLTLWDQYFPGRRIFGWVRHPLARALWEHHFPD